MYNKIQNEIKCAIKCLPEVSVTKKAWLQYLVGTTIFKSWPARFMA